MRIDGTDSQWGDEFNKRMMSFEAWVKETKPEWVLKKFKEKFKKNR